MSAIDYAVVATFPDEAIAREYVDWLKAGHVDAVVRAGAHSGTVLRVVDPPDPIRVEVRYVFPNRDVFRSYVEHHAPALRAEGLARYGPERGVRFERRVCEAI